MSSALPIPSRCHSLQLPPVEKDDRLNLNVRTGSASTLHNSFIFAFGGLTIGLDIAKITISDILYTFSSTLANSSKSKNMFRYLSNEMFYLSLIEKVWSRVQLGPKDPKPSPRIFHEILAFNNCIYLYGGLVINPKYKLTDESKMSSVPQDLLVPMNDFWEFNLETNKWTCYYDGNDEDFTPRPSFCNKMTSINSLSFVGKADHFGVLIGGGKDINSNPIYTNLVFDLVDKKFIPEYFSLNINSPKESTSDLNNFANTDDDYNLNIDYSNSVIINFNNQFTHYNHQSFANEDNLIKSPDLNDQGKSNESLLIYSPVKDSSKISNPLLSFKISKSLKSGKILPVHRKFDDITSKTNQIIPFNLRYPLGGLFGQNLILTGFLENDYDISIFVFNKPTGKWSRLNVFCNHDYGSHRFWGGFAWQSHHKVVLIGNSVTSRTTSAVRYFNCIITVSLPVTNILASSELAGGGHYHDSEGNRIYFDDFNKSTTDDSTDSMKSSSDDAEKIVEKSIDRPLTPPDSSRRPSYSSKGSRGSVSTSKSPRAISFSEYVHYAAPTNNFTTINSIFPPAAITLGRNFLDRFGDLTADFEIISVNGDRIPVSLMVLIERWGNYFIELLARGYVNAVEKFDQSQQSDDQRLRSSQDKSIGSLKASIASSHASSISSSNSHDKKGRLSKNNSAVNTTTLTSVSSPQLKSPNLSSTNISSNFSSPTKDEEKVDKTYHLSMPLSQRRSNDAPQFRLPFQDSSSNNSNVSVEKVDKKEDMSLNLPDKSIDPYSNNLVSHQSRKGSVSSFSSSSSLLASHLQDIPSQLPLPTEPIPPVPTNAQYKSSSRKNSNDLSSPRGSLIHTLTQLRNIPVKSPRSSPFTSPRASISQQGGLGLTNLNKMGNFEMSSCPIPNLKPEKKKEEEQKSTPPEPTDSSSSNEEEFNPFNNILLNFENLENGTFQMESSLIPRKLYVPFTTTTIKAFCEYLYTGQIGNKWLLSPTTLDNLALARHYKVPLLYDLISEVLFGIIGRREIWVIKRANELKTEYFKLLKETNTPHDPDFEFPLDEYQGFIDTVDDGYLDIALLKKILRSNQVNEKKRKEKEAVSKKSSRKSSRMSSRRSSMFEKEDKEDEGNLGENEFEADDFSKGESSMEKTSSNSEDDDNFDNLGIGYLDTPHDLPNIGPRSKSIFDRADIDQPKRKSLDSSRSQNLEIDDETEREGLTLEQLVSPVSPIPSLHTIELIFESVSLVADLKLMLRANNAKQMSKLLIDFEIDIEEQMEQIKSRYDETQRMINLRERSNSTMSFNQRIPMNRGLSSDNEHTLRPIRSTLSLTESRGNITPTMTPQEQFANSRSSSNLAFDDQTGSPGPTNTSGGSTPMGPNAGGGNQGGGFNPLERQRTNSSIRTGISGLTPFKAVKTDPKLNRGESNKDVDKRITNLIKRDEKLKSKVEKEEKARLHNQLKLGKKKAREQAKEHAKEQAKEHRDLRRTMSELKFDEISINSEGEKKKHGLFHPFGLLKTQKSEIFPKNGDDNKLTRSNSPTSIISKDSKSDTKKSFFSKRK
ncbi:negative regulator of sporulation Mds3p [[Candida] jaroonii]|uniref:Negative regulator of sporulation Mds3p n=1 Tax=[Candida] jaroonii TaxID=467808 RepID=A0ACA9Y8A0_9ASCO|nr:negative regulator of sporulation Mds3p [[Candida] jaroonii]